MLQRKTIENLINEEDFILLGVVDLNQDEASYQRYLDWLEQGHQAGMDYMGNHKSLRKEPEQLLPGARSCLVLAYNYNQGDTLSDLKKGPRVAQYARLRDYHKFLRKKGEAFVVKLKKLKPDLKSRVLVDSAPILEKAMAAKSALGFIGKNTLFIHPKLGSYYLLFEILLDMELPADEKKILDHKKRSLDFGGCGSCRRCSSFCPTGALDEEYVIDARKCLSYYTIEHRGTIPYKYWPFLKDYIFGCDICQLVCPYNRKAEKSKSPFVAIKENPDLFEIATMDQSYYERTFGGTPMTRAKKEGLQRNALIAMTVTKDRRLGEALALVGSDCGGSGVVFETLRQIEFYSGA